MAITTNELKSYAVLSIFCLTLFLIPFSSRAQIVPQPYRFIDKGNGTVTDKKTGLTWLKNANCFGPQQNLRSAMIVVNKLANGQCGLTDGSTAGQWRLPDLAELSSLIDYGRYAVDMPAGHPFSKVVPGRYYWSSTRTLRNPNDAVTVAVGHGLNIDGIVNYDFGGAYVWPVYGEGSYVNQTGAGVPSTSGGIQQGPSYSGGSSSSTQTRSSSSNPAEYQKCMDQLVNNNPYPGLRAQGAVICSKYR